MRWCVGRATFGRARVKPHAEATTSRPVPRDAFHHRRPRSYYSARGGGGEVRMCQHARPAPRARHVPPGPVTGRWAGYWPMILC
jgi:hypothetical protein